MDKDLSPFYKSQKTDDDSSAPASDSDNMLEILKDMRPDSHYIQQTSKCLEEILNRLEDMEVESAKNRGRFIITSIIAGVAAAAAVVGLFF